MQSVGGYLKSSFGDQRTPFHSQLCKISNWLQKAEKIELIDLILEAWNVKVLILKVQPSNILCQKHCVLDVSGKADSPII